MKDPTSLTRPGVGNQEQEALINAAAIEFMERGFAGTSVDAIADRLQATKGMVYHYYRSKGDLYLDVLRYATEMAIAAIEPLTTSGDSPAVRLKRMAEEHVRVILSNFPLQRVNAMGLERWVLPSVPKGFDHVLERRDRYESLFADCMAEGIRSGELRKVDVRLMVKPFLGALSWTVFWYRPRMRSGVYEVKIGAQAERMVAEFAEFVVQGLMA